MFGCAQETKTLREVGCKEGSYSCKIPIEILDIVKGYTRSKVISHASSNGVVKRI